MILICMHQYFKVEWLDEQISLCWVVVPLYLCQCVFTLIELYQSVYLCECCIFSESQTCMYVLLWICPSMFLMIYNSAILSMEEWTLCILRHVIRWKSYLLSSLIHVYGSLVRASLFHQWARSSKLPWV